MFFLKGGFVLLHEGKYQQMRCWVCNRETFLCLHSFNTVTKKEKIGRPMSYLGIFWRILNLGTVSWHFLSIMGHALSSFSTIFLTSFSHSVSKILTFPFSREILLLTWLMFIAAFFFFLSFFLFFSLFFLFFLFLSGFSLHTLGGPLFSGLIDTNW